MATFAKSLETKLKTLEASQTGIQTLSLWILHHKHESESITNAWIERVRKVNRPEKRLGLFYLANDVVQNGRKKAKDLVLAFGKAFLQVIPLFSDTKTKSLVERVFNIWVERSVYDPDLIAKLRLKLGKEDLVSQQDVKKTPVKPKPRKSSSNSTISAKVVPPEFKVSNLLVSIKKTTSLDNEALRKSKKIDGLKIDATSYDSIKNVKDRSSVGKFYKQFDESKIMLEGYIHTLKRAEKDKRHLLTLLTGGEAFYSLAQDEAQVIVNAYKTFGNRLNSMKKKLDCKIKKIEDNDSKKGELTDSQGHKIRPSTSTNTVQDMDLDSESGDEVPSSQAYNPSTAPFHDLIPDTPSFSQKQTSFFDPKSLNGMSTFLDMQNTASEADVNTGEQISSPISEVPGGEGLMMKAMVSFSNGSFHPIQPQQQVPKPSPIRISKPNPILQQPNIQAPTTTYQNVSNPSLISPTNNESADKNPAVQNLIDSLFPVLSKSLQTIKEKTQSNDEKPSVNAAMAFALGNNNDEESSRKKARFDNDPNKAISPVSLTNPKGLSDHQTELINIAAGITEFDENFLPVEDMSLSRSESREEDEKKDDNDDDRKRDDKKHRHRHRSHKDDVRHRRSSSKSPQRRSSHRSSRDGRDERRSERRRSSRRSPSPKRRSSKGSRFRRSSSRERDDKRKQSPGSKPYYNNRRSPTPEMDSASQQQFQPQSQPPQAAQKQPNQPQPQQIIPNPMVMNATHFPQQGLDGLPNQQPTQQSQQQQHKPDDVNAQQQQQQQQQGFINPQLVINHQVFSNPPQEPENQIDNPLDPGKSDGNIPNMGQSFPFNMPMDNMAAPLSIGGAMQIPPVSIIAPQVGFPPGNVRPTEPPIRLQQIGQNPLQLLQRDDHIQIRPPQLIQDDHLHPQFVQVNHPPFMAPPVNPSQDNILENPPSHAESPQQQPGNRIENFQNQFNPQPFCLNNQPPPFPGAPPVPPNFMPPGLRPPIDSEIFPQSRPDGMDNGNRFSPPGLPENINIQPTFSNLPENQFLNRPPFEQFTDSPQRFRPRFNNSPSRQKFRPRGGPGPRQFRPRPPRPVL